VELLLLTFSSLLVAVLLTMVEVEQVELRTTHLKL
jgi:hypothetical protein